MTSSIHDFLIFEQTTSPLYYSNDGRLHVQRRRDDEGSELWLVLDAGPDQIGVDLDNAVVVLATESRVVADAFIAGYDLARDPYLNEETNR